MALSGLSQRLQKLRPFSSSQKPAETEKKTTSDANVDHAETDVEAQEPSEFPPTKVVIPVMMSIYLTVFLSSLVSDVPYSLIHDNSDTETGPNNHWRSHSQHLKPLSEIR